MFFNFQHLQPYPTLSFHLMAKMHTKVQHVTHQRINADPRTGEWERNYTRADHAAIIEKF